MSQPPRDDWDQEDWETDEGPPSPASASRRPAGARPTPLAIGLGGAVAGALVMAVLLFIAGGNPFSNTNEVRYEEITVATVSPEGDRLCWSTEPERRDAPLNCAILALDPRVAMPGEGDRILAGISTLKTPGGIEVQQIVFAGPPGGEAPATSMPTATPDEPVDGQVPAEEGEVPAEDETPAG